MAFFNPREKNHHLLEALTVKFTYVAGGLLVVGLLAALYTVNVDRTIQYHIRNACNRLFSACISASFTLICNYQSATLKPEPGSDAVLVFVGLMLSNFIFILGIAWSVQASISLLSAINHVRRYSQALEAGDRGAIATIYEERPPR